MSWLARILIGLGLALVLLFGIVLAVTNWGTVGETTQAMTTTVGHRNVTIAGHYKNLTQEAVGDGVKFIIDRHKVTVTSDQLTVDGKTDVLEPEQEVEIYVGRDGKLTVKLVNESDSPDDGDSPDEAPG
jgi:hypothetical protein